MQSDYASVNTQAGIQAGDKGFQVAVAGNTDLKSAVIASNQNAIDAEFNTLSTKTLTVSDIALASLREKKLNGKCDASCQQEIDQLKQLDEQRNKVLDACQGVSSQICNDARQDVRKPKAVSTSNILKISTNPTGAKL